MRMPFLATLGGQVLHPSGAWLFTSVCSSAADWFLVECHWVRSQRARQWLTVLAPLVLLGLVWRSKLSIDILSLSLRYGWPYARFPEVQDYFADYVFIAVSTVLAWKAARLPVRDLRAVGLGVPACALSSLGLEWVFAYQIYAGLPLARVSGLELTTFLRLP